MNCDRYQLSPKVFMFGASSALIAAIALPASFAYAESVPAADNQGVPSELNVSKPPR